MTYETVVADAVERQQISSDGKSGAKLERVRLGDGTTLVLKHVRAADDWIMRVTGDDGRIARIWGSGLLDDVPDVVDHTMLDVFEIDGGWTIVMRDVGHVVFPDDAKLTRADGKRLLSAITAVHDAFRGRAIEGLCPIADRYLFLTPEGVHKTPGPHPLGEIILEGWSRLPDVLPADLRAPILELAADRGPLVDALAARPMTFIPGDAKASNMGFDGERVIWVDWGTISSVAPPACELAQYLAINSAVFDATLDELLDDIREACADSYDDVAMRLALLGSLLQLGWEKALGATSDDPDVRERERRGLAWWSARAREGLEHLA